jgi:hypothetical protein
MVAIVVEGKRDVKFFNNYIVYHLQFSKNHYKIIKTDGKSILLDKTCNKYLSLCNDLKAGRIQKVLFIVDSDNAKDNPDIGGYTNTSVAIQKLISDLSMTHNANYFIACNPKSKEGNIEDLVVSTLTTEQEKCITSFLYCSKLENNDGKRLLGIYNYGYPEEPYDFTHPNFDELKQNLQNLFKGI